MKIIPAILAHSQEVYDRQFERACQISPLAQIDITDRSYSRQPTRGIQFHLSGSKCKVIFHLMTYRPERTLGKYLAYKPGKIIVHAESVKNWAKLKGILKPEQLGIAINPRSSVSILRPHIADADEIVVMTVEPGDSGREFQPKALSKIKDLLEYKKVIAVDGGINESTIGRVRHAGASVAYVGSALLGKADIKEAFNELKRGTSANKRP